VLAQAGGCGKTSPGDRPPLDEINSVATCRESTESATLTCKPAPLMDKLKELSVNDPYSGKTVTGGIVTITDSAWLMSFTINRQPHFLDQPDDVIVPWVYALLMDQPGDYVKKPMPDAATKYWPNCVSILALLVR
jgi:myosin-crossreactive antigen